MTQQIKALAIPGASGTIFFAAYVVPAISGCFFHVAVVARNVATRKDFVKDWEAFGSFRSSG